MAKFFQASVTARLGQKGKKSSLITLTNNTSFDYKLKYKNKDIDLPAFRTVTVTISNGNSKFSVENMYHVDEKHPVVELKINK